MRFLLNLFLCSPHGGCLSSSTSDASSRTLRVVWNGQPHTGTSRSTGCSITSTLDQLRQRRPNCGKRHPRYSRRGDALEYQIGANCIIGFNTVVFTAVHGDGCSGQYCLGSTCVEVVADDRVRATSQRIAGFCQPAKDDGAEEEKEVWSETGTQQDRSHSVELPQRFDFVLPSSAGFRS